jgi:epoxyqueuosine reductase QueG
LESHSKNTEEVLSLARSSGAGVAGVADLSLIRGLPTFEGVLLNHYRYAISIGVPLPNMAVEGITIEDPGILYAHAYHSANALIDSITLKLSGWIIGNGHSALVIPASLRVDLLNNLGHASHKAFACAAGVGWIGRNGLLVNPVYGPRLRLGTVLTDMPLKPGKPLKNQCGSCRLCVESCPSGALKYSEFELYPSAREEIFDHQKCAARLDKFKHMFAQRTHQAAYAAPICGICIKVCPIGKSRPRT